MCEGYTIVRDHVLDSYIYKKIFSRFQENSVSYSAKFCQCCI